MKILFEKNDISVHTYAPTQHNINNKTTKLTKSRIVFNMEFPQQLSCFFAYLQLFCSDASRRIPVFSDRPPPTYLWAP